MTDAASVVTGIHYATPTWQAEVAWGSASFQWWHRAGAYDYGAGFGGGFGPPGWAPLDFELGGTDYGYRLVALPLWVLWAPLIAAALFMGRAQRPANRECCPRCNYDRRGLPVDAKCPECGTVPIK